ncbi:LamG-like jellyroll fold domain-containing protein [Candidatus Brocadia sinica]|uniref:LamG-like jellyroll fold domain-containing protein n=1 Tax=Candidatus Brocadia sinica JPN1 TaxID=1197129 RepID=A0ABQ0JRZ8_9BACT|nr:LamG-like jellyroll fold domain-containing protein [Candidatus Brocadia sinica]GAN31510.1 hypothetical protein BROSI_A0011 [Candidatus Brocadia sinica JPN1]
MAIRHKLILGAISFTGILGFLFILSFPSFAQEWGSISIGTDTDGALEVSLENSKIRLKYGRFFGGHHYEHAIKDLVIKSVNEDQAGLYLDACANRGTLTTAVVVQDDANVKTVRLEWDNGAKVSEVSIYPDSHYIKTKYLKYGTNIVDQGSPGGGGSSSGVYEIYGASEWKRGYVIYPNIYFDRYPGDVGYQNITEIDQPGPLDYHGWFIMGVYNEANGRGFGRVAPVSQIDIIKLLWNKGFELFPTFNRTHSPYTAYLFVVTGGGANEILSRGKNLADGLGDNASPTVAITNPTEGTTFTTPTDIMITATASDIDGVVSKVEYYAGSTKLGETTSEPHILTWNNVTAGSYVLSAKATDNDGATTTSSAVNITVFKAGMVGYYKFDEGNGTIAIDSSIYGNNGTINGATWTTGKSEGALSFDGIDDFASVPLMNHDEVSIAAWFYKNANDTTNIDAIFGGYRWNSDVQLQEGFDLRFNKTAPDILQFNLVTQDGNGNRTQKTAVKDLVNSVGGWYHVVGTYNKATGEQKLYVNGLLVNTKFHAVGNTVVPLTYYSDMKIGNSGNNGYFNGEIDDVRLYNQALANQEVQDLYNTFSTGLHARYTFDEGSGVTATDTSGNGNDGAINGATWTTGKNGGALSFDGIDDFVSVPLMNHDEVSIAAWFYKNAKDTTNIDSIFGGYKWNSDVQQQEGFDLRFYKTTPDRLEFVLVTQDGSGNRTQKAAVKDLVNSVGSWYHVVGTYNKATGEQKLYVNGQLVNTRNHPAGNTVVPLTLYSDMKIGQSMISNGYFNGKIDDFRLYNQAMTDQEVQDLYNAFSTGLQASYPFDEGSGTVATDASGNGNDGAISGATWTEGKSGNGLSFNGASNYVSIPRMNNEELSIAAWFYKYANDTMSADAILSGHRWDSDVQLREGFDVRFYKTSPDRLEFVLITQDGSGNRTQKVAVKDLVNSVGSWYHVAGTYNKATGEQKLYVNGQLVNTRIHPAGNTVVPLTWYSDMRIGHSMNGNGYFNGKIDGVKIYNRALTDQEVQDLYNAL